MAAADWFRTETRELPAGRLVVKPGVRGFPDLPPGTETLLRLGPGGESQLDGGGSAGLAALTLKQSGTGPVALLEPSAAALTCARLTFADRDTTVAAGLPWDDWPDAHDAVVLHPPADRGTARVELEISAAAAALPAGGRLLLLGHKDAGGKRYEKLAAKLFRSSEVIRRDRGYRLLECIDPLPDITVPRHSWSSAPPASACRRSKAVSRPASWTPAPLSCSTRLVLPTGSVDAGFLTPAAATVSSD